MRPQADPIIFSIFKEKSYINFHYKNLDVQINTSVLNGESKTQLQQLSSKTLEMDQIETMEYMTTLQSQPMLESEGEEVQNQQDQIEKNQDSSKSDIVSRHRIRYTATRIKYSPTRIKSRSFLSNILYTGINKKDFYNENFILDIFVLLVKNLNPFSLPRKVSDKTKHEIVYMIWRECIPVDFYRYILEESNFIYLNGRDVAHPGVLEIVGKFIDQKKKICECFKNILLDIKIYINMFTPMFSLKYIRHPKGVGSISKVIFMFCSNLTAINN